MLSKDRPTRVLFCSYAFHPGIGGIETVALLLAEKFVARGLDVQVITNVSSCDDKRDSSYRISYPCVVHRRPGFWELLRLVLWSDLVFHCNISLNYAWPLLLVPRPLAVASHTPIDATVERSGLKRWLKRTVLRWATAISVSEFLAGSFGTRSTVIANPLRRKIFCLDAGVIREKPLLFVGRLTRAKGADLLLEALAVLRARGLVVPVTIVGGGLDEALLRSQVTSLELAGQVEFRGPLGPHEVARLMQSHEVLVVPSRPWPAEALPMVPIEGIACGCVPVVAGQGGLPESVGRCGVVFESESAVALADALELVLGDSELRDQLRRPAAEFLRRFEEEAIVDRYLEVFAAAMPAKELSYGVDWEGEKTLV